ncbi:hypothetical protein [Streptomyces sp. SLBN-118]|uniref:hypothetical protein n=1 Tax=Streptomyces sp. SLBN-118 TaxID=2768454 RepID=UPI00114F8894|nr:hypothetical protein [Streptomyces sp. SLBN-118]
MSQWYAPEPVHFNSPAVSCDCLAHVYGNAADHPDRVRRYPSDMTDAARFGGQVDGDTPWGSPQPI